MLAVGALIPLSYGRLGKSWKHADGLHTLARYVGRPHPHVPPLNISPENYWKIRPELNRSRLSGRNTSTGQMTTTPDPLQEKDHPQHYDSKDDVGSHHQMANQGPATALYPVRPLLHLPGRRSPPTIRHFLCPYSLTLSVPWSFRSLKPLFYENGSFLSVKLLLNLLAILVRAFPVLALSSGCADMCTIVYSISILSTLPSSLHSLLPLSPLPTRFRPLFSVGVHDMPTLATGCPNSPPVESLAADGQAYGWVACTTDDILGMKEHLYDILVKLPPEEAGRADTKVWPKMQAKPAVGIRATQRDARRYRGLRRDLRRFQIDPISRPQSKYTDAEPPNNESSTTTTPLLPFPSLEEATTTDRDLGDATFSPSPDDDDSNQQKILEPQSWSALAYNSFIWWASAGEARTDREEESEYDASLLANLGAEGGSPNEARGAGRGEGPVGYEMALIAYFHRFTVLMLRTLGEIIDDDAEKALSSPDGSPSPSPSRREDTGEGRGNGEAAAVSAEEEEDEEEAVEITSDDITKMGLDPWSESDRLFVEELVNFYWGRRARVKGAGNVECCGVRVF